MAQIIGYTKINNTMETLKKIAEKKHFEIRNINEPLKANETFDKVITPFDFSNENGGTFNSYKFYNNFYLYPKTN